MPDVAPLGGSAELVTAGLDACRRLNKASNVILGKASLLDIAEQIHDLRVLVKIVNNFWVRG